MKAAHPFHLNYSFPYDTEGGRHISVDLSQRSDTNKHCEIIPCQVDLKGEIQ